MFETDIALYLKRFAIAAVPALLGIILHEVAHGWVASRRGDPTARQLGRLTLNPVPHIDPTGLLVFALTSLTGSFVFGWAKPVPVDTRYFRNPVRDMMLVALAGPLTNFALALGFALLLRGAVVALPPSVWMDNSSYVFGLQMLQAGIIINCGLAWLNLLPIPPLDGSKVLAYFLPTDWAWRYMDAGRYGFVVLLLLLMSGGLGYVLGPLVRLSAEALLLAVGL
ncbi:MAG: site-2 protease family protein [Desulfovibrionaceae bacterium]